MRTSLLLLTLFFSFALNAQSNSTMLEEHTMYLFPDGKPESNNLFNPFPTQRLDSIVNKKVNPTTNQPDRNAKRVYEYDSQNNVTLSETYTWNGTANDWDPNSQSLRTYDNNNNLIELIQYSNWSSSNFQNGKRYTYTLQNNQIQEYVLAELSASQTWTDTEKASYSYNSSNELVEMIFYDWNSGWEIAHRNQFLYDSYGNGTFWKFDDYTGGNWVPNAQMEYIYVNNSLTEVIRTLFSNGNWSNEWKYDYTYLSNGLEDEAILSIWLSNSWFQINKWQNTYDNLLNHTSSTLYNGIGYWSPSKKDNYHYNNTYPYAELISIFNEYTFRHQRLVDTLTVYDPSSNQFITDGLEEYYWTDLLTSSNELSDLETMNLSVFPNPAQDFLQFDLPQSSFAVAELYDSNGQFIMRKSLKKGKLELPALANGFYFYLVTQGDNRYSGKIVIM